MILNITYIPINHIGHNFKYSLSLIILVFLDSVIFFQLFKFIFQPLFLGLVSRVGILYQRGNCLVLQQGHHHLLIDFYLFLLKIKVHDASVKVWDLFQFNFKIYKHKPFTQNSERNVTQANFPSWINSLSRKFNLTPLLKNVL